MKKLKIYLDASAIGYLDEQSDPKGMNEMLSLWDLIKQGKYDVTISDITLDEINANKNTEKVDVLFNYLAEITYNTITVDEQVDMIADLVKINKLLISDKHQNDRLHIGCAIVAECDILVSYNFKHLVNVRTIKGVRGIASLSGYSSIDIMTPAMFVEEGDS